MRAGLNYIENFAPGIVDMMHDAKVPFALVHIKHLTGPLHKCTTVLHSVVRK